MNSLTNKRILLGVTGGIAAYKSADLIRRLQDQGADVRVVMTKAAGEFITALTLQALSGKPVHADLLDMEAEAAMGHIELARWGDAIVVAPASADFIARLCHGEGSDLLSTLCLATRAPILLAPAMNQAMWANAATQANIKELQKRSVSIVGPASGSQACGDMGLGRMEEVGEVVAKTAALFAVGSMAGKKVVITAGPTREAIDPVRYISNHSSGKMGYALAQAAVEAGADVVLISGPVSIAAPERVKLVQVESAVDMHSAVMANLTQTDVFIGSAAVADYRPAKAERGKIKKTGNSLSMELMENPDIIADVAAMAQKGSRLLVVGFAAETSNLLEYASQKRLRKKVDMIIANDVSQKNIGFNSENNAVTLIDEEGVTEIEEMGKSQLARELIQIISGKCK